MANKKTLPIKDMKKVDAFLKLTMAAGDKYYVIAKFQLNTGLRIVDVIQRRVSDIILEGGRFREYLTLKEQKTQKEKQIKLNDELKRCLKKYIDDNNLPYDSFLFPGTKKDTHITYVQVWRVFTDSSKQLSIELFGTHSLRKTWGYFSYKASKHNIGLIMAMFNHTSERETLRYIGIDQEEKDLLYSTVRF